MEQSKVWFGKAFCAISGTRPEFKAGSRGAVVVFACQADDLVQCCTLIASELAQNGLSVEGFEYLFRSIYMDRAASDYEQKLAAKLELFPVQFDNVHFFGPDS